jgi:hypothetical protein
MVLEDPSSANPLSEKKSALQIVKKWREIKHCSLVAKSEKGFQDPREFYLAMAKSLLQTAQAKPGVEDDKPVAPSLEY